MYVSRNLTISTDQMQCSQDQFCDGFILFSVCNRTAEQVGQHFVEILSHVVLGEDDTVEHEMGCSYSVLEVYVFYLFVKSYPEFTDVTSDEDSTS